MKTLSERIHFNKDDCVMYCVANYPAALGASIPAYIDAYRKLFNCKVGYSSHDIFWEINIAFLDRNVDIIERHFTENKEDKGLDISTSSDLFELVKLQQFCSTNVWSYSDDIAIKSPNQGELQNLKDLGSGYYFKSSYPKGSKVKVKDLLIKSPCRGLKAGSLNDEVTLVREAETGEPLSLSHLTAGVSLNSTILHKSDELQLSLPVRLHDYAKINNIFSIRNYEWHLSYAEVEYALEYIKNNLRDGIGNKKFSIHLPDYISPNELIDPNSPNEDIKNRSNAVITKVEEVAVELQQYTGSSVPVVGSFSVLNNSKESFYSSLSDMISEIYEKNNVKILPQFLPKLAWYFGGTVKLNVFCDITDINYFHRLPFGICLDTAHCIMAANFHKENYSNWIKQLLPLANHIHLSDASGVDGEGVPFGKGEIESELKLLLASQPRKVVEQWEGHLDGFNGFKQALSYLTEF